MQFKRENEMERKAHPQIGLIPKNLWAWIFDYCIEEPELKLLAQPIEDFSNATPTSNQRGAFVCIVVANPKATVEELLRVAQILNLKLDVVLYLAAGLGHVLLVEHLLKNNLAQIKESLSKKNSNSPRAYELAAHNGHVRILELIESVISASKLVKSSEYYPMILACAGGAIEAVKHFETIIPDIFTQMPFERLQKAYMEAAENIEIEVLKYIEGKEICPVENLILYKQDEDPYHKFLLFHSAIMNGDLPVIEHYEEKVPHLVEEMIKANNYEAYRDAVLFGHLHIVIHLESIAPHLVDNMVKVNNYSPYHMSVKKGYHAITHHLLTHPECFAHCKQSAQVGLNFFPAASSTEGKDVYCSTNPKGALTP